MVGLPLFYPSYSQWADLANQTLLEIILRFAISVRSFCHQVQTDQDWFRWHRRINRGILQGKSSLLYRQSCIRCGHDNYHNTKEDVDSSARVIVPGPSLLLRSSMLIDCIPCIVLSRAVYWTSQQVCSFLSTLSNDDDALHSSRACPKKIGIIESFSPCCWRYQRKLFCLKKRQSLSAPSCRHRHGQNMVTDCWIVNKPKFTLLLLKAC